MSKYKKCANCGNEQDGDNIYQCNDCGKVSCDSCKGRNVFGKECPRCKSVYWTIIGEIDSPSLNSDNDNEPIRIYRSNDDSVDKPIRHPHPEYSRFQKFMYGAFYAGIKYGFVPALIMMAVFRSFTAFWITYVIFIIWAGYYDSKF